MAYQPYLKVSRSTGGGAYTELTNVQGFSIGKGRQNVTDVYRAGTGTVEGRRPDLLPSISIGDTVKIELGVDGVAQSTVYYRVSDYALNYGIIASMDTWQITLEDAFGALGRAYIDVSWTAGTNSYTAFQAVCNAAGVTPQGSTGLSNLSAQSYTNTQATNILQTIMNTEQGYVVAYDTYLSFSSRAWAYSANSITFSDTASGSPIFYDELQFGTLADNYATKVIINPAGLAQQTSGSSNYAYQLDSYSQTTTDALSLAQYVDGSLSVNNSKPMAVSVNLKSQTNTQMFMPLNAPYLVQVVLRGSTYNAYLLGWRASGSPENMRFTYYIASSDFISYFILGNSIYGTLDYNKLGY